MNQLPLNPLRRHVKHTILALCAGTPVGKALRWHGRTTGNAVALTFDDGPHTEHTPLVLEKLARHGVRATFFVVGEYAERHPELLQAIVAAGHEIGNHTYRHNLVDVPGQIRRTERFLKSQGIVTHLYRPPYGSLSPVHLAWTILHGYSTVMWSHDTKDSLRADGKAKGSAPEEKILPGDIILMHDDNAVCVQELEALIAEAKSQGLRFVALSELR